MRGNKVVFVCAILSIIVATNSEAAAASDRGILWVEVSGYISTATAEHVSAAVEEVSRGDYSTMVLAIDTFGGEGSAMFRIIESIQGSPVPVIGFVYPPGKQALSAGTYILMATDFAAMAPFTTIGSAQPVIGQTPSNETKFINALTEKMRSYASLHNRNATEAIRFITHNDNLSPERALRLHVIDAVASDPRELLSKADGAKVMTLHGEKAINTSAAQIIRYGTSIRVQLLKVITDPAVTSLLLGLGFLMIVLGLGHPGWGGEVAGVILIILGLAGTGFNINLSALLLMAIGAGLLIYEIYSHALGIAAVGGIISLGIGMALMITRPPAPVFVSEGYVESLLTIVASIMIPIGGFFGIVVYKVARAVRLKRHLEPIPKGEGHSVDDLSPDRVGFVVIGGEYWRAKARSTILAGSRVQVIGSEGRILIVETIP